MTDETSEYEDILPDGRHDTRIGSDEGDDLPVSPPDKQPRAGEFAGPDTTGVEETIDQRIMQEEPDPDSAYGAPDDEGGLNDSHATVGGDDPDAIPAEQDILGGESVEAGDFDPSEDPDAQPL